MLKNLVRNGFTVTAISDVNADKCRGRGYPDSIAVAKTNREVVEATDVIVTGK